MSSYSHLNKIKGFSNIRQIEKTHPNRANLKHLIFKYLLLIIEMYTYLLLFT